MKLKLTCIAFFAAISFNGFAQQTEKATLQTISAPSETAFSVTDSSVTKTAATKTVVKVAQKPTFSLAAGTMFGSNGMATYLAPTMYYRLNQKFSLFTGVTYLNSNFNARHADGLQPMATKNYLVHVGGMYDVSEKLQLSGSIWRDFSGVSNQFGNSSNFRQPARYGTEFNASYKVNEFLSIHGSVRSTNGNPYNNGFNNGINNFYNPSTPFGY